jgi:hypothetical protein
MELKRSFIVNYYTSARYLTDEQAISGFHDLVQIKSMTLRAKPRSPPSFIE